MARLTRFLVLGSLLTACSENAMSPTAPAPSGAASRSVGVGAAGAVFTQTNATAGNAVLIYRRSADGSLSSAGSVATGGTGTGAGLGSQGAVTLSDDGNWLLVVNAGSNEVSSFSVGDGTLTLRGRASSGGTMPISVTVHDDLVYVLNAGGTGNISGLRLAADGSLSPIASSTRGLSTASAGPAEVRFDATGAWLVVTEKNTNKIDTWHVGANGLATGRVVNASSGITPFGFTFTNQGILAVSEAFGGAANASATSTYTINADGTLHVISASVPTTETSACWAVATNNGRFVFVTNATSGSVSGYSVRQGQAELLKADGKSAVTGAAPTDEAISQNSQFLYTLNGGSHTISSFGVSQATGELTAAGAPASVPVGVVGIAAK
ncbi:MAG TPA: beta-propeller fold lactonase family protein [Gemmatimonadaceae bacterium]|nr:beta-propeller fold lactonase family protein [Gemmatimonadaceae bacterium]